MKERFLTKNRSIRVLYPFSWKSWRWTVARLTLRSPVCHFHGDQLAVRGWRGHRHCDLAGRPVVIRFTSCTARGIWSRRDMLRSLRKQSPSAKSRPGRWIVEKDGDGVSSTSTLLWIDRSGQRGTKKWAALCQECGPGDAICVSCRAELAPGMGSLLRRKTKIRRD